MSMMSLINGIHEVGGSTPPGSTNLDGKPRPQEYSLTAQSHCAKTVASAAPANCATMKAMTPAGAMPAKVFEKARANVTAGFANEVDAVNQ
jgi:hypothetical protein